VLVLRNGFVLQGRITPVNEMILVTIGSGNEVRLPRAEVEFQSRSLDDAYLRKRDGLISDDAAAHLDLAEWCLRHGLLARASDQLLQVFAQEPTHPRLAILEQRLQALGKQALSTTSPAKPKMESVPAPQPKEAAKLSPQLMQQFTTVVQPILLNRCAAYTCHGGGSTGRYRLIRPSSGSATTSRVTQRNLQATLSFVDQEHPERSLLLERAGVVHGGIKAPIFTERHAHQLELLSSWVRRAALTPTESIAANRGGPKREPSRSPAETGSNPTGVVPAGHLDPLPTENSRDPFDPEIFNRQYHPAKQADAEPPPESGT
jgi:hypothetical protein